MHLVVFMMRILGRNEATQEVEELGLSIDLLNLLVQ